MNSSETDKREFKRIGRKFIMRVALDEGAAWPRWSLVTTHNISAGGALFTFDQPVKKGESLVMNIHFLDKEITCKGRVLRFDAGFQAPLVHIAVSFEGLTQDDKAFVDRVSKNFKERRRIVKD